MKSSDGTLEFGKGTKDGRISVFFRKNDETFCPVHGVPRIPEIDITQRPAVSLGAFPPNSTKLDRLIDLLDWAVEQFESSALPT
jgi:hypothetical protein